jgi:flagellar motor switch protein FliN/FliY
MSQFDEALASPEWAFTLAAALEQQLRDDRIITVGSARAGITEVVHDEPTRAVTLRFTSGDGQHGSITLVALAPFAEALERAASDEILLTACAGALDAAVRAVGEQAVTDVDTETAAEIDPELLADETGGDVVVYPLLDGTDLLGCLVLRVSSTNSTGATTSSGTNDRGAHTDNDSVDGATPVTAAGASYVLADVEMGVTAELGRCRMTVRELLSITPGAVIDLDRAAGAPVDVLVNGTLIARGEVVVIDEEFGIRISELVPQPAAMR